MELIASDSQAKAKNLIPAIEELRQRALRLEQSRISDLELVDPDYKASARNLLHYLAVRQSDIRPLQRELVSLGLTSLGNVETAVLNTLDHLLYNLHLIADLFIVISRA